PHGTDRPEAGPPGEPVKPVRHGGLEVGRAAEARFGSEVAADAGPTLAKPPVRKLARELGIDLRTVRPTGDNGVVTREDVKAAAALLAPGDARAPSVSQPADTLVSRREAVRGVTRMMAAAMTRSALTIPHVTEWVDVDVTRSVELIDRLRVGAAFEGVKVTPLTLVARACLAALRRSPIVNSVFDAEANEIVHRSSVNLGIAADTPRGLVVPNVKGADQLSLPDLARALNVLTATARAGKSTPADLTGGTFTITNVGVFGVDGGTPIINPGESSIAAIGAWRERPWVLGGQVVPRTVATVSLSFDHRFIDGAMGSRFLRDVADLLEEPAADLAW
ncbi:MAG TPA: dihydrolipoamide acetyltransferase family protein, partial [Actinomycetes bacterium]|nr:dihydrolipoamide acetyltransferase family protein [Actinomycetes bacterium]